MSDYTFAMCSSMPMTSLPRTDPDFLGHFWSSSVQPFAPAAMNCLIVRCTFRTFPPPVASNKVYILAKAYVEARRTAGIKPGTSNRLQHNVKIRVNRLPVSASTITGTWGMLMHIWLVFLAISGGVRRPTSGSPSKVADTCTHGRRR